MAENLTTFMCHLFRDCVGLSLPGTLSAHAGLTGIALPLPSYKMGGVYRYHSAAASLEGFVE